MSLKRATWGLLIAAAFLSSGALLTAGYRYAPTQVDGGWASYGGYAVSLDREPYLHQATPSELEGVEGLKSLFIFDTVSNTRALYSGLWFRVVGRSWRAVKLLSLLELTVLLTVAWFFFRRLLPDREIALLALLLLATDKMVVLMAASTFRPDVAQAALACFFYLVLRRAPTNLAATGMLIAFAALAGMFSATAVTPVALASVLRGTELIVLGEERRGYRLGQLSTAVAVAAVCYLTRQRIFPVLLGSEREVVEPAAATARIAEAWGAGPGYILGKEVTRWGSYLAGMNFPLLLVLMLAVVAWLLPGRSWRDSWRQEAPAVTAVLGGVAMLLLLDPHPRPQHLAPAAPFLLLLLGRVGHLSAEVRKLVVMSLMLFIGVSSVVGFGAANRMRSDAVAAGFSNAWLEETLHGLSPEGGSLVVAGGTEFWSYFDVETDITIIDLARGPISMHTLEETVARLDLAVLSADYRPEAWLGLYAETYGVEPRIVIDKRPYVVVAEGLRPEP